MSLRERVRRLREEYGWSQGELVEKLCHYCKMGKCGMTSPSGGRRGIAAQWLDQQEPGGPVMSLRERVRRLPEERGWSQGELAGNIRADPAQISRYKHGRITPSASANIRLAEPDSRDRELVLSFIGTLITKARLKALADGIS